MTQGYCYSSLRRRRTHYQNYLFILPEKIQPTLLQTIFAIAPFALSCVHANRLCPRCLLSHCIRGDETTWLNAPSFISIPFQLPGSCFNSFVKPREEQRRKSRGKCSFSVCGAVPSPIRLFSTSTHDSVASFTASTFWALYDY